MSNKQKWLDGFPAGATKIGGDVLTLEKDGLVFYLVGGDNYFSHKTGDEPSVKFALCSLMDNGYLKACELQRPPLSISHRTLMNWNAQYRKEGPSSFYQIKPAAKPRVITPDILAQCKQLQSSGKNIAKIARLVEIGESTVRKAMARQRRAEQQNASDPPPEASAGANAQDALGAAQAEPSIGRHADTPIDQGGQAQASDQSRPPCEATHLVQPSSSKSQRSRADAQTSLEMGMACTRADERVACAMGLATSALTRFEAGHDVPMAGLLAGLPALHANGLLSGLGKHFALPKGFYSALHILLVLGFMALGRIRRPEGLRHIPPGEFGKVVGLDRVPEVRTLRQKIAVLAKTGQPAAWMQDLSSLWMQADPQEAGYLYVDGHVRVYNGDVANLPRRFVSRERLCLRGTTDYWVNDALGRPFFVVSKAVSEGLPEALIKDIVPELLKSVPGQPSQAQLDADPLLHRFCVVFDREGSHHSLLSQLWEHRIGGLTYRKRVTDEWPEDEFKEHDVSLPEGASTRMRLAMRQTQISAGMASIPVTQVRRLTQSGHQTAVITTARELAPTVIAARMFARWCQENFFAYMMQHYDIDGLIEYGAQEIPGTTQVINPQWRELGRELRQVRARELQCMSALGASVQVDEAALQKKAEALEALQAVQTEKLRLRALKKETPKKVTVDSLPVEQRPTELRPLSKILVDAVKMVAYRAETAMVVQLRRHLSNPDEARALVRELFVSSGDIEPNAQDNTLTIRIHRMANPAHDRAISLLLKDLTDEEFTHPDTGAKMVFCLV